MKALTLLGIILLSNLHFLTSDPSKSIDHLKKKSASPEVVKKHSAKKDTEHHEFNHKKEFHLENDEKTIEKNNSEHKQKKIPTDKDLTTHSTLITSIISSEAKDSENGASKNTKTDKKDKVPKSLKVRERKRKLKEDNRKDSNDSESKEKTKSSHSKSVAKDSSAASSERVEDSIKHSIVENEDEAVDTPLKENSLNEKEKSPKADAVKDENTKNDNKEKEKSPKADAVKDENTKHDNKEKEKSPKADAVKGKNKKHGNKEKEKGPKADAVKDENTEHDSKEKETKSNKKNARKGRKKKFHPKKIVIADEVVGESQDKVTTEKNQATTLAEQEPESEYEEYNEQYNEYNLPEDDKVIDAPAKRRLKTRVTIGSRGTKKNSSPLPKSTITSGKNTVRGKVTSFGQTKSEKRGTTRSSVSKHTLNGKVSKEATKNTPGTIDHRETSAVNKIASTKLASEVPISVTESTMREESRFKEKELTTCRNNTDCQDGKYCMVVHDANLRVCVEAKDVMRIYKDAVAYPHVDFPYENLLSRENKYQHCEADADCSTGSEGITLHCQNMACLGKICVEDPINGCISGFDCPEQYNCVRPSCGSQLQTEFGICIPLAPMDRLIQSSEIEI